MKKEIVTISKMTADNPLKRFAVVHVGGKKRQNFRVWYKSLSEAETAAAHLIEQHGSLYVVVEIQSALFDKSEYKRKFEDLKYNDVVNVAMRKSILNANALDMAVEGFGVEI